MHSDILQTGRGPVAATGEAVWQLQINRPARRNAVDSDTAQSLAFMLREADRNSACRVVLLSGSGAWFCAGSDLKELAGKSAQEMAAIEASKAELVRTIQEIDLPVVCAVEGLVLGGGVSLATSCDFVVTSRTARWQMPEVANGWLPPWGIEPVLRRCGAARGSQVLWGADPMDGDAALRFGLADFVVEAGESVRYANELAARLAQLPPIAARAVKRYVRGDGASLQARDQAASTFFIDHCQTDYAKATLAKFGTSK